jgi:hypothetical protein
MVTSKSTDTISWWETRALVGSYAAIFLISAAFIYIMYTASWIISESSQTIDSTSYFQTHLATFIVEIVLWVVIARAAIRLKSYTRLVISSKDGQALDYIANAFLLSLAYAIFFGMASTIKTLFWHTPYLNMVTTITNLLPVAIVLLGTVLLFIGSVKLARMLPVPQQHLGSWKRTAPLIAFLIAAGFFAWYLYRSAPSLLDDDGLQHFALSPILLLFTYIIPYIAVWLFGLLACLNIAHYANHVKGIVYRPLFRNLYKGLMISFIGTYLAQAFYLSNLPSNRIGIGLLIIIGVLLLLIYGCLLVYRGTSQLSLIEK